MSRSYKYPIWKQHNDKYFKKLSNRKIRKYLKTLNVGFKSTKLFKLLIDPWNICDWKYTSYKTEDVAKAKRK